jgi:hypothetical protein
MHQRILALCGALVLSACSASKPESISPDQLFRLVEQIREGEKLVERWQGIAAAFAFSSIFLLLVGTAIGSKARRDANRAKDSE